MKTLVPYDYTQKEIRNAVFHLLSGAPSAPLAGQVYYNQTVNGAFVYNGSAWRPLDAGLLADGSIANSALTTNPLLRSNHTGTQTASTISDLSTTVKGYTLDSFAPAVAALNLNSQRISSLAAGTALTDATNLQQVNQLITAAIAGQTAIKNPVRVVAANNITLSGLQTVDGVSLAAGDRVLPIAQSTGSQNLIYVVQTGTWTVATDNASAGQLIEGTDVLVAEGTQYGGSIFRVTTTGTITPGTTSVSWVQTAKINTYTADGLTLTLTGQQFSVLLGSGLVASSGVAIDRTKVPFKYAATITGDGSTSSWTLTHGLNTQDITVSARDSSQNGVIVDWNAATVNTVVINTGVIPNGTAYRIVVMG